MDLHQFNDQETCINCGCKKDECPDECPKQEVSAADKLRIKNKTLDYRDNKWREYVSMRW